MRAEARALLGFEREDRDLYARAVAEIGSSPPLRGLLRYLYTSAGMANNPFTENALTTAHNTGKMALGQDFFSLLNELDPALLPGLLQEMNDEHIRRRAHLAAIRGHGDD